MDNNTLPNPLPEKVLRRHAELLSDILPEFYTLVSNEGRPADVLLNRYLRTHREMGSRDRRFLSQAVFSFFRWRGWTVDKLGLTSVEACLLGTLLDTVQLSPSFQFLQTICKLPSRIQPMGDKSLQEKCDTLNKWFKGTENSKPLELVDLVPADFTSMVDPAAIERCIVAFQQRPPAWLRSRTTAESLMQALAKQGVPSNTHSRVKAAVSVDAGNNLTSMLASQSGRFVIQDLASQCVGLVCAPSQGEEWWDCCAGAGGKSLHLMDLMQQDGKILATDVRIGTLKELRKRARRYGIRNIRTHPFNAASDEPFRKTFDGVLVDAPCSGWGTWARNPDARWRTSQKEVIHCANRQLNILNNATWCVKPGGVLLYAVCTLTRPETEEVVMNFMDQHPDFKLDPFPNPLTGEQTAGTLQIWPWDGPGDAMFIARFTRMA